ncbi:MAG: hypothetical protein R3C99_17775 [Pirellulaceae bacterium]
MADSRKMSIEEILAAARRKDGPGDPSRPRSEPAAAEPAATEPAAPSASSAPEKPAAPAKKPGQMSVADMLAAARAEKSARGAPAENPQWRLSPRLPAKNPGQMSVAEMLAAARGEKSAKPAAPASKPAAAKATPAKPAAKEPAAAAPVVGGPKDTASILAAARKDKKPGPVSKSEAAAAAAPAKPGKKPTVAPPMPEKPAYARPAAAATVGDSRRGFFATSAALVFGSSLAIGFSSLAVTNLLWVLGLARFHVSEHLDRAPNEIQSRLSDDFGPGQVEEKYKAQFGVWIVRYEYEGAQIYALKAVQARTLVARRTEWKANRNSCPCHGSGFYKDGVNFEGPAPRPLERYAISPRTMASWKWTRVARSTKSWGSGRIRPAMSACSRSLGGVVRR